MKTRNGFVSNSSSASFVINRNDLSKKQLEQIVDYYDVAKEIGVELDDDWAFLINCEKIIGSTSMDNDDFRNFLQKIGVDLSKVSYSDTDSDDSFPEENEDNYENT